MSNLKKAFSEVDMILDLIDSEMKNKVSANFIKFIKEEKDNNYKPNINPELPLEEQNILPETIDILALLKLNYWCNEEAVASCGDPHWRIGNPAPRCCPLRPARSYPATAPRRRRWSSPAPPQSRLSSRRPAGLSAQSPEYTPARWYKDTHPERYRPGATYPGTPARSRCTNGTPPRRSHWTPLADSGSHQNSARLKLDSL